jgi:hypothetical protein
LEYFGKLSSLPLLRNSQPAGKPVLEDRFSKVPLSGPAKNYLSLKQGRDFKL